MPQQGLLLKADGTEQVVESKKAKFSLDELQGFVGGYIELAPTKDGRDMYLNEEGKLDGLPLNPKATALYKYAGHDVIVGDMIIVGTPRKRKEN
jgi:hypothetical protein